MAAQTTRPWREMTTTGMSPRPHAIFIVGCMSTMIANATLDANVCGCDSALRIGNSSCTQSTVKKRRRCGLCCPPTLCLRHLLPSWSKKRCPWRAEWAQPRSTVRDRLVSVFCDDILMFTRVTSCCVYVCSQGQQTAPCMVGLWCLVRCRLHRRPKSPLNCVSLMRTPCLPRPS
jgi:hypothetical protein